MTTPLHLSPVEARVLGALVEKEITTPEYYPLSLNALVNACNQKSNRDPVMTLDEDAVRSALRSLTDQFLVRPASTDGRVAKYEHRLQESFNFYRPETAVLTELLLRGPQTPGELRSRAARMHPFEGLDEIHSALNKLMQREPPLVAVLPRQPGTKEARYAQLLSGEPDISFSNASTDSAPAAAQPSATAAHPAAHDSSAIAALQSEVAALRAELDELKRQFAAFQQQFS